MEKYIADLPSPMKDWLIEPENWKAVRALAEGKAAVVPFAAGNIPTLIEYKIVESGKYELKISVTSALVIDVRLDKPTQEKNDA